MIDAIRYRIAFIVLSAVIVFSPLLFGSVDESVIALWIVCLAIVAILQFPSKLTSFKRLVFLALIVIAGAWGLVTYAQSTSSAWFSENLADPVWRRASSLLHVEIPASVSVVRNQPLYSAGNQILAFLSFLSGFFVGEQRNYARKIVRIAAWSGAVYACFAIFSFIWDPTMVLWREKVAYKSVLTGTFINRNTAATYFGCCSLLWLLLFFRSASRASGSRAPAGTSIQPVTILAFIRSLNRRAVLKLCLFGLLLCTTFMTGSRAGSLLTLLACAIIAFFSFREMLGNNWRSISALGLVVFLGLAVLLIAGSGVDARFSSEALANEARFPVYRAVLRMIAEHPLLGTGLGTFAWIFPSYRPYSISSWGVWDRAHSTLLEVAAEQGIPFALLLFCSLLAVFAVLLGAVMRPRHAKFYPAAGLALGLLSCTHSLIDFSLQIPSIVILVFTVLGVGLANSRGSLSPRFPAG